MNSFWLKINSNKTASLCLKFALIVFLLASAPLYLTAQGFDWYAGLESLHQFILNRSAYVNVVLFSVHLWCYLVCGSLRRKRISSDLSSFLALSRIPLSVALCTVVLLQVAASTDQMDNFTMIFVFGTFYALMLEYNIKRK
jgi:fumarate reductase subunit C